MIEDGTQIDHVVIIASLGRPLVLGETLQGLERQTRLPETIVLSVTSDADLPARSTLAPNVRVVQSERGLTVQRNAAFASLSSRPDFVTYLDDDIELRADYCSKVVGFMASHPEVALMTGMVVADGIHLGEIDRERARRLLDTGIGREEVMPTRSAYGCNMTARGDVAAREPFDERMRLYAWQEDTDFSVRCARYGSVVHYKGALAVHMAVGAGRIRGTEFGFAQIVNPYYMWRKGTKTTRELLRESSHHLMGNLWNFRKSDRPDRRGRLAGNFFGIREIVVHGGRPEAIEQLRRRPTR